MRSVVGFCASCSSTKRIWLLGQDTEREDDRPSESEVGAALVLLVLVFNRAAILELTLYSIVKQILDISRLA
jgi:hypothetical protein